MSWNFIKKRAKKILSGMRAYLLNWKKWPSPMRFIALMICGGFAWVNFMPFNMLKDEHWTYLFNHISEPLALSLIGYLLIFATFGTIYSIYARRLWKSFE